MARMLMFMGGILSYRGARGGSRRDVLFDRANPGCCLIFVIIKIYGELRVKKEPEGGSPCVRNTPDRRRAPATIPIILLDCTAKWQRWRPIAAPNAGDCVRGGELDDWLEAETEVKQLLDPHPGDEPKRNVKTAFLRKLEAELKDWDAKLAKLKAKAHAAKAVTRDEFELQLESLAANRALAQEKLQELREHGEWPWEDLEDSANQIWNDLARGARTQRLALQMKAAQAS